MPDLSGLRRRLGYLEQHGSTASTETQKRLRVNGRSFLETGGWARAGEAVYQRRLQIPLESHHDLLISRLLVPGPYDRGDLLFYDTETTGLSGGAGTIIFLFGLATLVEGGIVCEQFFLADFPGEPEFLDLIQSRLDAGRLLVSYNGKSFDSHLLRTRFLMNGLQIKLGEQLDLLFWARRLWKRTLGDCSLSNIEHHILEKKRETDVHGYEVPGIYLRYLRGGETPGMAEVIEHNLNDVISLADLLFFIDKTLRLEDYHDKTDFHSLGAYLLKRGDPRGVQLLQRGFSSGIQESGRVLSLYYKRQGIWDEATRLWRGMYRQGKGFFSGVELAKYYEHREHQPAQAFELVQQLLSLPLESRRRQELLKRRQRLERKLQTISGSNESGNSRRS